jgi:exodeoxyribonuclease VII large subunit
VWVAGEISNLSRPQSGHVYFTLKDDTAQLRGVLWRSTAVRLAFVPADGLHVICRGRLDVYPPRGTYQLVASTMEPRGVGSLELALRQLREKLAREGLFDPSRKRPLPLFPRTIALITSPTGAAVHDFLQILRRRWRAVRVIIVPVRVQGVGAAEEISQAIHLTNRFAVPVDVVVVARGGGSLEDLWAFNEEMVVRALAASRIPTVSAVGHEIDVTLSDLAADVRALTPSEAAERLVPSKDEVREQLDIRSRRLAGAIQRTVQWARGQAEALSVRRPFRLPLDGIRQLERRVDELSDRLHRAAPRYVALSRRTADALALRIDSLSPLAVLARGYSLTLREEDGRPIDSAEQLALGERIVTRFAQGLSVSRVEGIEANTGERGPS